MATLLEVFGLAVLLIKSLFSIKFVDIVETVDLVRLSDALGRMVEWTICDDGCEFVGVNVKAGV